MLKLTALAGSVSLMAMAGAANAAVVIDGTDVGSEYVINFTGQVNGSPAPAISSVLTLTFNGTSDGGKTYKFGYDLLNDSSVSSRLRSFGFDVADASFLSASATATDDYGIVGYGDNYPEGMGVRDVCFRATGGSNCTGGPNGITSGTDTSGTFTLTFSNSLDSIALDNFVTRYQSISPTVNGGDSGVGIGTPVAPGVPEPATWALMILGFGAVGVAMRRRKIAASEVAYA